MSIESKHAYRFGYLKSEQWKTVRLEALVREKAKCQICGEESISNDAHHIWYPENIYETKEKQLVVLCRTCHEFLHVMLPECKTDDEGFGRAQWMKFRNAIVQWRISKVCLFDTLKENTPLMRRLGEAYDVLKNKFQEQCSIIQRYEIKLGKLPDEPPAPKKKPAKQTIKDQIHALAFLSKRLERDYANREKESVAGSDKEP